MTEPLTDGPDDALDEEAARWSERLREAPDDAELRAAFDAWAAADPARRAAFERAEHAFATAQAFADAPELRALRYETMARTAERRARRFTARVIGAIAACLLIVAGGAAVWMTLERSGTGQYAGKVYETAVGQRLVVTLEDDSVVTLDTATRVAVDYSRAERRVTLLAGQAFFKVAHDTARPFAVIAGPKRVVAVGTAFDVRMVQDIVAVTLVEGRVRVETAAVAADAPTPTMLAPGEQLVERAGAVALVRKADIARATSWRHGQAIFENDTLAAAVAEMNRYSRRPIVLADSRIAALRISGAFETGQSDAFVEALTTYFPAIVVKSETAQAIELAWRN